MMRTRPSSIHMTGRPRLMPGRLRLIAAVAALASLTACVEQSPPPLGVLIPASYQEAGANPDRALPSFDWWRAFRSPELRRLIEQAQLSSLDIAAAVARIEQADAQAKIAGAALLPAVGFSSQAQRSQTAALSSSPGAKPRVRNLFQLGANASYELDFWGKNRELLRAAEQEAVASRFTRDVVELSTVASVANDYFLVLASRDRLRIARENLETATSILGILRNRLSAGTGTALDLAQQEALVANIRASIPPLKQQVRQTIVTLAVLLGQTPEGFRVAGGGLAQISIPRVTPGMPSELLLQRPDIRAAEAHLVAAHANVAAARAAFFPTIQLTGSGGLESLALKSLFGPHAVFWSLAEGLTQPIFDGFRLEGSLEQATGRRAELLQLYRKSIISGFADVENALIAMRELAEEERLRREALAASRRAYEISEARLREGTVDLLVVLNAQQTLFSSQDALVLTQLQRMQAIVALYQALGGGWAIKDYGLSQ